MYSRKFNGMHSIPPDYSGIAIKPDLTQEQPEKGYQKNVNESTDSYETYPKYPVYQQNCEEASVRRYKRRIKRKLPQNDKEITPQKDENRIISPSQISFSIEDVILAGLILVIMNEKDRDDDLLIILVFLLLIGIK